MGGLGASLQIFFVRPFGPQFGLKIRGEPGPLGPYPRSTTATVHTYPVKTVSENASFQKHSPDRRFLKCRLIVWTITEVFEYDIMMLYIIQSTPCKACNRNSILRSVFVWTGKKRVRIRYVWRLFFRQWTKKSPFSKISGHVWTRPKSEKKQLQERVYNSVIWAGNAWTAH